MARRKSTKTAATNRIPSWNALAVVRNPMYFRLEMSIEFCIDAFIACTREITDEIQLEFNRRHYGIFYALETPGLFPESLCPNADLGTLLWINMDRVLDHVASDSSFTNYSAAINDFRDCWGDGSSARLARKRFLNFLGKPPLKGTKLARFDQTHLYASELMERISDRMMEREALETSHG
jgi:hypothetical protein